MTTWSNESPLFEDRATKTQLAMPAVMPNPMGLSGLTALAKTAGSEQK